MASKRPVILMAILLILVGGWLALPYLRATVAQPQATASAPAAVAQATLPGTSTVSNLTAVQQPDGQWLVSFDYFYTGEPREAYIFGYQRASGPTAGPAMPDSVGTMAISVKAQRGAHKYSQTIRHPRAGEMAVTTQIYAVMRGTVLPTNVDPSTVKLEVARTTIDVRIVWPDPVTVEVDQAVAEGKPEVIVQKAADLIDTNDGARIATAQKLLQTLVERQPRVAGAYVELARVVGRRNTKAGLTESEGLLRSALEIDPESANARILLGYTLTLQERYKEAESLFVQAAATNPPNLWLWANWGQLQLALNKKNEAVKKYREAIARPPTRNGYDRARQDAYDNLFSLYGEKEDLDTIEALFKQRTQEYPNIGCYNVDHARFLVLHRGKEAESAALLRDMPSPQCQDFRAREVQGLGHYVRWSRADAADKPAALLLARSFIPSNPQLFHALASGRSTEPVARQLVAAGGDIGVQDNAGYDALGYALSYRDLDTARSLLRLGAKPTAEQGNERMPAALIPVMARDEKLIRLMQRSGVDYSKLRWRDRTATELARESGDKKLMQLLEPKAGGI